MVANIRRYKGMNPPPKVSKEIIIREWKDWKEVEPAYTDYIGDTESRNHSSAVLNPAIHYTNTTGRNDFTLLKVARDKTTLYFLAETDKPIILGTDEQWMRLYINSDRKHTTGWMGYDFRINSGTDLQQYKDGQWSTISKVRVKTAGKQLMYSFPLNIIVNNGDALNFEFKWSDNMKEDDPMDWYINGDVAPGGRFNYVYQTE